MNEASDLLEPQKARAVRRYIEDQFPASRVTEAAVEGELAYSLRIESEAVTYVLHVERGALDDVPPEGIEARLEDYRVADILEDIGDFPMVITASGCIFGSP